MRITPLNVEELKLTPKAVVIDTSPEARLNRWLEINGVEIRPQAVEQLRDIIKGYTPVIPSS